MQADAEAEKIKFGRWQPNLVSSDFSFSFVFFFFPFCFSLGRCRLQKLECAFFGRCRHLSATSQLPWLGSAYLPGYPHPFTYEHHSSHLDKKVAELFSFLTGIEPSHEGLLLIVAMTNLKVEYFFYVFCFTAKF